MKKLKWKTVISIIIVTFMVLGLLPGTAAKVKADDSYDLYVGGIEVTSSVTSGDGWSYDAETNTLVLTDFSYQGTGSDELDGIGYYGSRPLNLVANGYNSIAMENGGKGCYGIYSVTNMTIGGTGKLYVSTPNTSEESIIEENYGILCEGNLEIYSADITILSGSATQYSFGISVDGKITVHSGDTLASAYNAQYSTGIHSEYGITVIDGKLSGYGSDPKDTIGTSYGIRTYGELNIMGGAVFAYGGDLGTESATGTIGIYVSDVTKVSGGSLEAEGGTVFSTTQNSYGIYNQGEYITIGEDAEYVMAKGKTAAVFADTFSNGLSGIGWSDYDGTTGDTEIPVNSSYDFISGFKKIEVSKPKISALIEGYSGKYDKKGHTIKVTVYEPESGYTIKYGTQKGNYNLDKAPTFKEIGTHYVFFKITAEGYRTYEDVGVVEIKKVNQTITAKDLTLKVGQSAKINAKTSGDGAISYKIKVGGAIKLDKDGTVTGLKKGTAYVLVTASATETYNVAVKVVKVTVTDGTTEKTVDMLRLYNPNSGEHFYTASKIEKEILVKAGWKYEGIAWKAPVKSKTPVYRMYNANAGDHHYTISKSERDTLIAAGWKDEGIGWYSDDAKTVPLHRLYNPNAKAGSHHYTISQKESDDLVKAGWKYEGIAWYGR